MLEILEQWNNRHADCCPECKDSTDEDGDFYHDDEDNEEFKEQYINFCVCPGVNADIGGLFCDICGFEIIPF